MASEKSIWYRIGHALESARQGVPSSVEVVPDSDSEDNGNGALVPRPDLPSSDELFTAGATLLLDRLLDGWGRRRDPGLGGLVRAAAAGAVSALLADLVRPLIRDDAGLPGVDRDTAGRMLAGLGEGLIYGGVVEPRIPGPALFKGAVFGSLAYVVHPFGGLSGILGSHAPQRRIPFVGPLLDGLDDEDRAYLEHLVFAIALALIYESSPSSNGIRSDEE